MSVDLSLAPWTRLAKLAPTGTSTDDLQEAADRYAINADLYAALADLWEDAANAIDTVTPDSGDPGTRIVASESVSQDGISRSVTYADTPVTDSLASRMSRQSAYANKARQFRARAKTRTALMDGRDDDPYERNCDNENIIPIVTP